MYLETIGEQSRIFLYSCGFGFVLGFLFSIFEFFGVFFRKNKTVTFIKDVIYMIVAAFSSFLFSLSVGNGNFKFYIYSAFAVGWLVYYFSVGTFERRFHDIIYSFLKDFYKKIKDKKRKEKSKKLKKSKFSSNLLLQDEDILLYNKKDNESLRKE